MSGILDVPRSGRKGSVGVAVLGSVSLVVFGDRSTNQVPTLVLG